jgi:hypothetical protein
VICDDVGNTLGVITSVNLYRHGSGKKFVGVAAECLTQSPEDG